jgi:hypothetical protein
MIWKCSICKILQQEVFPKVVGFRILDLGSFLVCFRSRPHKLCLSVAQWFAWKAWRLVNHVGPPWWGIHSCIKILQSLLQSQPRQHKELPTTLSTAHNHLSNLAFVCKSVLHHSWKPCTNLEFSKFQDSGEKPCKGVSNAIWKNSNWPKMFPTHSKFPSNPCPGASEFAKGKILKQTATLECFGVH